MFKVGFHNLKSTKQQITLQSQKNILDVILYFAERCDILGNKVDQKETIVYDTIKPIDQMEAK